MILKFIKRLFFIFRCTVCNTKSICFLLCLLIIHNVMIAQSSIESYFKNDSIKFQILRTTKPLSKDRNTRVLFYHLMVSLPEKLKKSLLQKDSIFWLKKFDDEKSDWAANVLLYYIYERDAALLVVYNTRDAWLPYKQNQVRYWRKYFAGTQIGD